MTILFPPTQFNFASPFPPLPCVVCAVFLSSGVRPFATTSSILLFASLTFPVVVSPDFSSKTATKKSQSKNIMDGTDVNPKQQGRDAKHQRAQHPDKPKGSRLRTKPPEWVRGHFVVEDNDAEAEITKQNHRGSKRVNKNDADDDWSADEGQGRKNGPRVVNSDKKWVSDKRKDLGAEVTVLKGENVDDYKTDGRIGYVEVAQETRSGRERKRPENRRDIRKGSCTPPKQTGNGAKAKHSGYCSIPAAFENRLHNRAEVHKTVQEEKGQITSAKTVK